MSARDNSISTYRVPVLDKCQICNGPTVAVHYRMTPPIKGWIRCNAHGFVRDVTDREHTKFLESAKDKSNPNQ